MNINPKLEALLVPTAELVLDPKNARKHPKSQVEALAKWIDTHGLHQPIVLDGKKVIKGNCVLKSVRFLGWDQIPAVEFTGDAPREFAIVDNRSAELSSWDIPVLEEELASLENIDISSLGFDTGDLTNLGIDLDSLSAGLTGGVGGGSSSGEATGSSDARELVCPRCGKRFAG